MTDKTEKHGREEMHAKAESGERHDKTEKSDKGEKAPERHDLHEKAAAPADPEKKDKMKKPEAKKPPHEAKTPAQEEPEKPGFKGIVRIAGRDIRGHVRLKRALTYVRGIGNTLSVSIARVLDDELHIPPDMKIGELDESQIESIDRILFSLHDHAIPRYLFNRGKDFDSGTDRNVIMNDLIFALKQDVEREKKAYTWKGYRHSYGQKVRGQRTRNTGRTGMAVGVMRKTVLAAAAAAKEGAAGAPGAKVAGGAAAPAGGGKAGAAPAAAGGGKAAAPAAAPKAAGAPKPTAEKEKK